MCAQSKNSSFTYSALAGACKERIAHKQFKEKKEVRPMWFIFLIACIVVALAALLVILIGSVVVRYIVRKDREMERKFFEMDKENKE